MEKESNIPTKGNKFRTDLWLYLLKRILLFIPTLLVITLLAFGLTKIAPGDPIHKGLNEDKPTSAQSWERNKLRYQQAAENLGLHLPAFYFSISPKAYPDTLYRIYNKLERETQEKLIAQYGNWREIEEYYQSISFVDKKILEVPDSLKSAINLKVKSDLRDLYTSYQPERIRSLLNRIRLNLDKEEEFSSYVNGDFALLQNNFEQIEQKADRKQLYIPDFKWYGFDNQYHHWLMGLLGGDFGKSYKDFRPIGDILKPALAWTLTINIITILLAYGISIPLGVFSAMKKNQTFDKVTSFILFLLFSLPVFWIGTTCLVFFTTPEYGMDWFDGIWISELPKDAPFLDRFMETSNFLVLPILCLLYPSIAFLTRQMRGGMLEVLDQPYIQTAWAKGLSKGKVYWKHAFRNALFPIITIFASIFPTAITGAVVIEFIYQIPGMGWITLEAITEQDWPIVFGVLLLGAVLTLVGILVADILYAFVDPRVSYRD